MTGRWKNRLCALGLLLAMSAILFLVASALFSSLLAQLFFVLFPWLVSFFIKGAPQMVLHFHRARELRSQHAPELFQILRNVAYQADISPLPRLFLLPTHHLNAFSSGNRDESFLAVSDGLLKILSAEQMEGVLAHEMAHLKSNDPFLLKVLNASYSLSHFMSIYFNILIFLSLPFILIGKVNIPWGVVFIVILAPVVIRLITLALMRNREYAADLLAVAWTQKPRDLCQAIEKINRHQGALWGLYLWQRKSGNQGLFDTHPEWRRRIKNIKENAPSL